MHRVGICRKCRFLQKQTRVNCIDAGFCISMEISLQSLAYTFLDKPLLIGGKAMEFYNLRQAGADIDFVISARDHAALVTKYPDHLKDLYGDIGVIVGEFEIWNTILLFDYTFLGEHSIEQPTFCVLALDKLLFLKSLAMRDPKNAPDIELIVAKINAIQYGKDTRFPANYFSTRNPT